MIFDVTLDSATELRAQHNLNTCCVNFKEEPVTTVTFRTIGEVEVNADGKVVTVPTSALAFDQDLREVVTAAMTTPGVAITVPSTARLPRPRNSRVHGIAQ